jgi:hypothetical protein
MISKHKPNREKRIYRIPEYGITGESKQQWKMEKKISMIKITVVLGMNYTDEITQRTGIETSKLAEHQNRPG